MILDVDNTNIGEILSGNKLVILDFWAGWCNPCSMLMPIVHAIGEENKDIIIGKVDVDANSGIANKYQVRGIPSLIFIKEGEVLDKTVGIKTKAEIEDKIAFYE